MSVCPATTLYDRILAATQLGDRNSTIRELRVVLELLFKQLTRSDNRSFGNLYARIEYVYDKMQVKELMQEQVNSLRIFCNKVAHDQVQVRYREYYLCVKTLAEAVHYFYEVPIPDALKQCYHKVGNDRFVRPQYKEVELVELMKPVVLEVGPLVETKKDFPSFTIKCRDEELGEIKLQLWKYEYNDLTRLQAWLKPFDTLHVINCKKSESSNDHYSSVKATQVVLEPDILLDISELAECVQGKSTQPLLAILKKLVPQEYKESAFQGNMVNALLDAAITAKLNDFKNAYREAVAENVLQAAAYGRDTLVNIFNNIRNNHWRNVKEVADSYAGQPTRIEPSFFSALYGLQGRLDLMVEDPRDPLRKEILELKSGTAPNHSTWRNHEMQVVGYNLLLRSTFGKNRTGGSAILYSAAKEEPLRNIVSNAVNENQLIMLRNEVLYYLLQLAAGDMTVLDKIQARTMLGLPGFIEQDVIRFQEAYAKAGALEKKYYHHFLCFLLREWLHEKCGMYGHPDREEDGDGFAALWLQQEDEKRMKFNIINGLQYKDFTDLGAVVQFTLRDPGQQHNFRPGDAAILYRKTSGQANPLAQQVLKGRVDSITGGELVFSLNNRQLDSSYFEQGDEEWIVEHDIYEKNFWVATSALFSVLLQPNAARFRLLMGMEEPKREERSLPGFLRDDPTLNDNQRGILQKALSAKDYFLVQGPPGTGKTSTLLPKLVLGLQEMPDTGSILIVAFTNRAVDEIANRLEQQSIPFIRFGSRKSKAEQQLRAFCTDGQIDMAREYIQSHRVFLATVTTMSGRLGTLRLLKDDINTLIVDEASQLTEPQLLGLVMEMRKFILIGDQNQLPPVVAIHEAFCTVEDHELQAVGIDALGNSLFERLYRNARQKGWHHATDILTTHFRMHDDIAALINHWYGNQLRSGRAEQQAPINWDGEGQEEGEDPQWGKLLQQGRVIFLPSRREAVSKYHEQEAERVVSLLRYLKYKLGKDFNADKVGVVTPWRTQIGLIRNKIGNDPALQGLNIDTVERFQGSENDIIIVSLAIYHPSQLRLLTSSGKYQYPNAKGELEEVEVDRKLLVTLSRARSHVVVLGDEGVLKGSEAYRKVVATAFN